MIPVFGSPIWYLHDANQKNLKIRKQYTILLVDLSFLWSVFVNVMSLCINTETNILILVVTYLNNARIKIFKNHHCYNPYTLFFKENPNYYAMQRPPIKSRLETLHSLGSVPNSPFKINIIPEGRTNVITAPLSFTFVYFRTLHFKMKYSTNYNKFETQIEYLA